MARQRRVDELNEELERSGNLIDTVDGYVELPVGFDEDRYYYYRTGGSQMTPVQLVGGMIQKLKEVDGRYEGPAEGLPGVVKLFTLKDVQIGDKLQGLISIQGTEYSRETHKKYLDAAHRYAELREKLMHKMITVEEASLLFQGDEEVLPSTKSRFSLGYNEDAYIKSSIAYEIEMYLRSIFSSYGLLDGDIKNIFHSHNLKEAFLKLPRTVRTKVYQAYKDELRRKALAENIQYFANIVRNKNLERMISIQEKNKESSCKEYLMNVLQTYDFIKNDIVIAQDAEKLIARLESSLFDNEHVEQDGNGYILKINFEDKKAQKDNKPQEYKHSIISEAYIKYEKLGMRYESYVRTMNNINEIIRKQLQLLEKLRKIEKSQRHEYKNSTDDEFRKEYEKGLDAIRKVEIYIEELKAKIIFFSSLITNLEDEMSNFVFADELGMETAYQDNRYTFETDANNNYDNLLILLNCLKKAVDEAELTLPDYRTEYESISQTPQREIQTVISASRKELELFDRMFSRTDEKFTCNGRKTREGQISRFFRSTNEPKLDALYSAELRYSGALQIKGEDNNLFMAELGIASELYLKSLLRSRETTHKLHELYIKLDNDLKSRIIRKVNSILGLNLSHAEFQTALEKETITDAFTNYRYLYENEPQETDINFLNAVTQALHLITKVRLNYKSPYYDEIERTIHPEEDDFQR